MPFREKTAAEDMHQPWDSKSKKSSRAAASDLTELLQQLKQPGAIPGQFLADVLAAQCLLGQAEAGAILLAGQNNDVEVLALYPYANKDVSAPEWLTTSAGFARNALSADSTLVRPLDGSDQSQGRAAKSHVVMVPLNMAGIGKAVAAFVTRANSERILERRYRRMELLVGPLSYSQNRPAQQNWQESCRRLQRAIERLSAVNRQGKFAGAAMAFGNEVASQWQYERVSIGFLKRRAATLDGGALH